MPNNNQIMPIAFDTKIFKVFLLLTFFKIIFTKELFQEHYQSVCQSVWIQIKTEVLSILD